MRSFWSQFCDQVVEYEDDVDAEKGFYSCGCSKEMEDNKKKYSKVPGWTGQDVNVGILRTLCTKNLDCNSGLHNWNAKTITNRLTAEILELAPDELCSPNYHVVKIKKEQGEEVEG